LIQNPIVRVLSTFRRCEVRSLLMGGQACIIYGAAEFSRDRMEEQERERALDREYWRPLREDLEALRRTKGR
jgi:hypothetical protein